MRAVILFMTVAIVGCSADTTAVEPVTWRDFVPDAGMNLFDNHYEVLGPDMFCTGFCLPSCSDGQGYECVPSTDCEGRGSGCAEATPQEVAERRDACSECVASCNDHAHSHNRGQQVCRVPSDNRVPPAGGAHACSVAGGDECIARE